MPTSSENPFEMEAETSYDKDDELQKNEGVRQNTALEQGCRMRREGSSRGPFVKLLTFSCLCAALDDHAATIEPMHSLNTL